MKPLITIGFTSYNSKETIEAAIQSAVTQDYENKEILIVDDCSPDGSGDFLLSIQEKYKFRLIRLEKNAGVANARNVLIENAQGEFLAFFDDDDISLPTRLSKQLKSILDVERQSSAPVASFIARTQVYPDGLKIYEGALALQGYSFVPSDEVLKWSLLGRYGSKVTGAAGSGTTLARVTTFRKLNGYDVNFKRYSDTDFLIRFAQMGGVVVGIQESLMNQGMTIGADKSVAAQEESHKQLLNKHEKFLQDLNLWQTAHLWMDIKFGLLQRSIWRVASGLVKMLLTNPSFLIRAFTLAWSRRKAIQARAKNIVR